MTGSHIPRPPVTEDVGKAIAREIKGPPSSGFASEVPIAFVTHPASPADPEVLTRTRWTIIRVAAVVAVLLALLLTLRWIAG